MSKRSPIRSEAGAAQDMTSQAKPTTQEDPKATTVVVGRGRQLLPSEEALIEFGRNLVKDSLTQALDFHKTMLGLTATFATLMASSFALLTLGSKDASLYQFVRVLLVVPILLMLSSAVCFALGYYPRRVDIVLNDLTEIKRARDRLLASRYRWAVSGIVLFCLSIVALLVGVIAFNVG